MRIILFFLVISSLFLSFSTNTMEHPKYKIYNLKNDFLLEINEFDFKLLKNSSKLLQDQCDDTISSEDIYVSNDVTTKHINVLLRFLTFISDRNKKLELKKNDQFALLQVSNLLDITDKMVIRYLKKNIKEIELFCRYNKITYDGLFLSQEFKSEVDSYKELAKFFLSKSTIEEFLYTRIAQTNQPANHLALSKDGKKLLCFADTQVNMYIFDNNLVKHIATILNVKCAGMSADGSTVMVGKWPHVLWYDFTDEGLVEKGAIRTKVTAQNRAVKEFSVEPGSSRNGSGGLAGNVYNRQLPFIFLSEDGKIAFLKVAGLCPLHIQLNDQKDSCIETKFTERVRSYAYNCVGWHQQIIAMSASGVCAHLVFDDQRRGPMVHYLKLDTANTHDMRHFDSKEYMESKKFRPLVDLVCLDKNANHILKIEDGNATIAYRKKPNKDKEQDIPLADQVYAGALSLKGKAAVVGGATGAIYSYDTKLGDFFYTIPMPSDSTNTIETKFNGPMHKFVPQNHAGITALAINKDGTNVVVGRTSGAIDYYSYNYKEYANDIYNLDVAILEKLSNLHKARKHNKNIRPMNIGSLSSILPTWIQTIAKKELSVRTGWGPRATLEVLTNNNIGFYYKCEAIAPYIIGATAAITGGYLALKHLSDK